MTDKKTLRKEYKAKRATLTLSEIDSLSKSITDLFFTYLATIEVKCIHVFLPIEKQKEINTWEIIKKVWKEHPKIKTVVPVIAENSHVMRSCQIDENSLFKLDKFGIPNPTKLIQVEDTEIDLVLTPLLCINEKGQRIGYGKGFYDRFFSRCKPNTHKIGLSFFGATSEIFEVDEFDVALDGWITPHNTTLLS